jgi:hypothetical protein
MQFVELRSFDNCKEAASVLQMLQSFKVNCYLKDEPTVTFDPVLKQTICGIKLLVHPADIETAWTLLDKAEQLYLKNVPCPVCKTHALTAISITKNHKCRLAALACMLLKGVSIELAKLYKCTACGYDFKELPVYSA